MSKEINKIYNKAIKCYHDGEYQKALVLCEEGISKDLKNTALLNLKGLLYYLNGDLKQATALWNINIDNNNDELAKVYLKDSKNDNEKFKLYLDAENNIKELDIDGAINKLRICERSDFNSINVKNALAICYIRKGQYDIAKEYNNKSLQIDINNEKTLHIKKELKSLTNSPKKEFSKRIGSIIISLLVFGLTALVVLNITSRNNNHNENNEEIITDEVNKSEVEEQNEAVIEDAKEEVVILNDEEVKEIYIKGTDFFEDEKYDKAIEVLSQGVNNDSNSYLNEHILFLLASSYENNNNLENGIKYYENYVNKYSEGSYIDEVYYKLAIIYKGKNEIEKSKKYANILNDNYPNSIYINTIIKEIISS